MKKVTACLALMGCFVLASPMLYAGDSFTDWERGVFMEVVERWHEYLYTLTDGPGESERDYTYQQVAAKYNISIEEVGRIENKAVGIMPSDREFDIYDDLSARLDAMPKGATTDDARRIHYEIINKYGISLAQLHAIEYVMEVGYWYY